MKLAAIVTAMGVFIRDFLRCAAGTIDSRPYSADTVTQKDTSVANTHATPAHHDKNCGATIDRLLRACCPKTVTRFVDAVVVDAVDRHSVWHRTHVCKKTIETVPSLAHGYAASAVIREFSVLGVAASLAHRPPAIPYSGMSHSVRSIRRRLPHVCNPALREGV